MDSRTKATGFYRGDAARIVSEAARLPSDPVETPPKPASPVRPPPVSAVSPAPVVILDDPSRPPLSPAAPTNQNLRALRPHPQELELERPSWTMGRIVAWILLAPWYVTIAAASLGVDVLFVKDVLGL